MTPMQRARKRLMRLLRRWERSEISLQDLAPALQREIQWMKKQEHDHAAQ